VASSGRTFDGKSRMLNERSAAATLKAPETLPAKAKQATTNGRANTDRGRRQKRWDAFVK